MMSAFAGRTGGPSQPADCRFDPKLPPQRSLGSERCGQSRPYAHKWEPHGAGQAEAYSADRSRILTHIVDPGRIDDHVLSWEPIVVISQIVIDPIAVVVDVGLCELHAGKRYARGRIGQLLTRPHFLNLHSSGGNGSDLAVAHFGKDIGFLPSRMDLVLAILFDFFAKKVFSVEMMFLLREGDARRVDRGGCRDQSECETPIDHQACSFWKSAIILRQQRRQEFLQPL